MRKFGASLLLTLAGIGVAAPAASGGLALPKAQWDSIHKVTGKDIMGPVYDGKYIVSFMDGKVQRIEIFFTGPVPVTQAQATAKSLLPKDAKFVKKYSPTGISEKSVFLYKSAYAKGDLHFQYNTYPDSPTTTKRLIVALGNNP